LIENLKTLLLNRLPSLRGLYASREARRTRSIESSKYCIDVVDVKSRRRIRISRSNAVFILDVMDHFEYYFGSAEPIRVRLNGKTCELIDFSTPRYHDIKGFADFPVFCPTLTEPFITIKQYQEFAQLRHGDVVLDLGAYSGLTTICFSKAVGSTGKVVALEPDPESFIAAKKNIEQHIKVNKTDNIALMQNAVAQWRGIMKFSAEGTLGSAAVSIVGRGRGQTIDVDCVSLADIAQRHELTKVDFIKMDVEGAEEGVLAGADEFFNRYRPRVIIEPHFVRNVLSSAAVIKILQGYDYDCESIQQYGVNLPLVTASPRSLSIA
jgi:FkbM family methyltransferase